MKNSTKELAIAKTGYSEKELIRLAITIAQQKCADWLREAEDSEGVEHYSNLNEAWDFIWESYKGD